MRPLHTLLALVVLLACAFAQGGRAFDADKDLPGFEAAGFSEWSDLYAFESFKAENGKALAAAELEALRARWKAEQERAQKRIAEIRADPRERWVWQLGKRLARHSYFSKIAYTIERPDPGFVMVLQRPAKEDPGYAARVTAFYLPFARKAAQNFEEQVGKPAGLVRQEGRELTAFAVLASKGDFENFTRFVQDENAYSQRSAYDAPLQLAVVYEDAFAEGASIVAQHTSLCYRVIKALQHACLAVPGNRVGPMMLDDGLASLFAAHEGPTPEALDKRKPRATALDGVVGLLEKQETRELLLLPFDELAGLRTWDEYDKLLAARAKRLGAPPPAPDRAGSAYYAQAELWPHFLFDGADGAHRAQLLEFVKSAFQGHGGAEDLRRAFGLADMGALSREFLRWACVEYERTHAGARLDRGAIDALFLAPSAPVAASTASAGGALQPSASAAAPLVAPAFSPEALAPHEDDAQAQLALALLDAREGDIERGLENLRALAARSPAEPWGTRVARNLPRLEELAKLRRGYLASLAGSGAKLSFKHQGKALMAPVAALEADLVRLGENRLGLPSIPLSEVDPYEIAKVAAKPEQQGGAQPWARFFAYAIAGDARWEKLLKDDSPAARELRADAPQYAEYVRVAAAARELYELSKLPLPREAQEAALRLERVRKLLADNPGPGVVARQRDALRELAKACLLAGRRPGAVDGLLHCAVEALEEGKSRLVWNFDSPEEALDWTRDPAHLRAWLKTFPKILASEADSGFKLEKGRFVGLGSICYRCNALFEGPITLTVRERRMPAKGESAASYFDLLICDEGEEQYIVAAGSGFIRIHDRPADYEREARAEEKRPYMLETDYDYKLEHDGEQVSISMDGALLTKAGCGPRRKGAVALLVHSDMPISIESITIEGRLQAASLRELEGRWVAKQLAALGFP